MLLLMMMMTSSMYRVIIISQSLTLELLASVGRAAEPITAASGSGYSITAQDLA